MSSITLVKGDCLSELDNLPDKTAQLICIDPPYNIGKDTWDNISNYQEFMLTVIKKLEMKLRDNGSFFMFHNDMETISELIFYLISNSGRSNKLKEKIINKFIFFSFKTNFLIQNVNKINHNLIFLII